MGASYKIRLARVYKYHRVISFVNIDNKMKYIFKSGKLDTRGSGPKCGICISSTLS